MSAAQVAARQVDSLLAVANEKVPGLPWQVVAVLIAGYFVLLVVALRGAKQYKDYAQDFPTQTGTVVLGIFLTTVTAPVVLALIALGIPAPEGTGEWLAFLAAVLGVAGVGGLAVKRLTSPEYQQGRAAAEVAKAAATPPQPQPAQQVNVAPGGTAEVRAEPTTVIADRRRVPRDDDPLRSDDVVPEES